MNRRQFLKRSLAAAGGLPFASRWAALRAGDAPGAAARAGGLPPAAAPFRISLAEWSLVQSLHGKKFENLDFPRIARREFGIEAVEYVDQFFSDKAKDTAYLADLKKRCDGEGVRSNLIMIDTPGALADADEAARLRAVEGHKPWIDAARFLGCHSIRVNAWGKGTPEEMGKRMADSGAKLAEYASKVGLNVIVENHGGPSSDPAWLTGIMSQVGSPFFGTLPDFGNFPADIDRSGAVARLMPYARGVSSKGDGPSITKMMRIVLDAGYRGWVGIESGAPSADSEFAAVRAMKEILEGIRAKEPSLRVIFDGKSLEGWEKMAGGDWSVEDGAIVGRSGTGWSTDPARSGSWLRTAKEYADFDLYLEACLGPGTNSGVFLRSGLERNPAFTGYEVQLSDAPGLPPSKKGPGSLYDLAAPAKNRIRPAGEWNELRVVARGPAIRIHLNGEMVLDAKGDRRPEGFIGLQVHDAKSIVRFRNIGIAEL